MTASPGPGMRICAVLFLSFVLAGAYGLFRPHPAISARSQGYDLLIRNGTILDGTGREAARGDLGVQDGKIARIGRRLENADARVVIDAEGLIVAPGFIDVHNHTEFTITDPAKRFNEGLLRQGVTTIVGGADGTVSPEQIRRLAGLYEKNGIGTNVAFYVGHNAIRFLVMAGERRAPSGEELAEMKKLVREGMELGAVGFSSALMYQPGTFSKSDELVELAREAASHNGIYDSLVRNPGHALLESCREAIEVGRRAGIPVKIAHEEVTGLENQGLSAMVVKLIEEARAGGLNVVTDQCPYDASATADLAEIIRVPGTLHGFSFKESLHDPDIRSRLKDPSENGINGGFSWLKAGGYSHIRILGSKDYPELVGRYLSELAGERKEDNFDFVCDLLQEAGHPVWITLGAVREEDVRNILVQPWNMIVSDGIYSDGVTAQGHPRSTGAFPKVLGHYVRDLRVLTLPEAVRKMTSLPADFIGLHDRGRIKEGLAADIVIFDPRTIADRSTWDEPQLYAVGVQHVIVNGAPVLCDGKLTGQAPGRFLKRQR